MQKPNDFDLGEFDREYGLPDLLPQSMIRDLLTDLGRCMPMAVTGPDGDLYYDHSLAGGQLPLSSLDSFDPQAGRGLISPGEDQIQRFALRHELEDIGYLVIKQTNGSMQIQNNGLGRFIADVLNLIIQLNHRILMTSGLHLQVVDDSYRQLQEKAAKLQLSEAKYRKLSENLEAEVQRQTEDIRTAQLMLLQQEKLASIGQLAAGMAHEINNPIGFIISNLNTLKTNVHDVIHLLRQYQQIGNVCNNPGGIDNAAKVIRQEMAELTAQAHKLDMDFIVNDTQSLIAESLEGAGRISAIVANLRDFAHPSVDTLEHVNINHCLDTTLSILSTETPDKNRIRKQYHEIPNVHCYLRELNQVFFHILRNALQAVAHKGEILIRTQMADDRTVLVIIADTGTGIPEAHRPHLFEPFFTTRQVGSGTGLGLHLAYNIIKKHGGLIEVQSKVGAGSVFKIHIPVDGPQGQPETVAKGSPELKIVPKFSRND